MSLIWLCIFSIVIISSASGQFKSKGVTHALVIGISDYQDDQIPDLKYAHSDAKSFAEYLKSPSGGSVEPDFIHLLTNEEATCGNVHQALDKLLAETHKNDKVYIFFSGHGDVESIDDKEQGHLLLYNTSASVYQLCSVKIEDLKKVITQLSNKNQAKVILITDACRSGALAGETIKGPQATASAMYQSFSNEVKLMSCQPNEFSHEGEQWDGGAFTHFLVRGLTGLADNNGDEIVNLGEIDRYLSYEVSQAVLPNTQTPIASGDKHTKLSFVDEAKIKQLNEEVYANPENDTDANVKSVSYFKNKFNQALEEKRFVKDNSGSPSAMELYEEMQANNAMKPMMRGLKGDLVSALQDDVQESIKAYLKADNQELKERFYNKGEKYKLYPEYLKTAAELLGQEHYLYQQMTAKKLYFEAVNLRLQADYQKEEKRPLYEEAMEHIQEALIYEDRAAYIYNELGLISYRLGDDNCEELYRRAIKLSPTWAMPYSNLSYFLLQKDRKEEAKLMSEKAIALNAEIAQPYYNLSQLAKENGDLDLAISYSKKALKYIKKANSMSYIGFLHTKNNELDSAEYYIRVAIEMDSSRALFYENLGNIKTKKGQFPEAIECFKHALGLDSSKIVNWVNLGVAYSSIQEYKESESYYLKALSIDPNSELARMNYGILLYLEERYLEAVSEFDYISTNLNAENYWPYFNSACSLAKAGKPDQSILYIQTLISKGFSDIDLLVNSEDLESLQEMDEFKNLVNQIKKR
jgi:tetratricopeptide (TPR) repeat protein